MDEKRKFERFSVNFTASYTEKTNSDVKQCTVTEISRDGVRLRSIEKVGFGQKLHLHLDSPCAFDAQVTVKWSKPLYTESGEEFLAGGALENADPKAIRKLMAFVNNNV